MALSQSPQSLPPQPLPLRANLDWLKKESKQRLAQLRASDPQAKLAQAQLAVARNYGFASWRKLKAHIEQLRQQLDRLWPADSAPPADAPPVSPDDPDLAQLLAAIRAGDLPTITELLRKRRELVRAHGPDGETPLHAAAECNDDRLAVYLLAGGADPNAKYGKSGHSALSWAVTRNSLAFAKTLVRLGIQPDLFCAAGIGALEHVRGWFDASGALLPGAAQTGSTRLLADGTRLPCPPPSSREQVSDALYVASRNAQVDVVRFLLTKDPDLAFRAYMGGTPLHWAHFGGSREIVSLIEEAGADRHSRDDVLRCTPRAFGICVPASWGIGFLVRKRLADDPTLAQVMVEFTGPLHQAAREGHVEVAQMLLEAGADPAVRDGQGQTPLEISLERGHAAVAELLKGK
jgi:ankyrin repeat protein